MLSQAGQNGAVYVYEPVQHLFFFLILCPSILNKFYDYFPFSLRVPLRPACLSTFLYFIVSEGLRKQAGCLLLFSWNSFSPRPFYFPGKWPTSPLSFRGRTSCEVPHREELGLKATACSSSCPTEGLSTVFILLSIFTKAVLYYVYIALSLF